MDRASQHSPRSKGPACRCDAEGVSSSAPSTPSWGVRVERTPLTLPPTAFAAPGATVFPSDQIVSKFLSVLLRPEPLSPPSKSPLAQ